MFQFLVFSFIYMFYVSYLCHFKIENKQGLQLQKIFFSVSADRHNNVLQLVGKNPVIPRLSLLSSCFQSHLSFLFSFISFFHSEVNQKGLQGLKFLSSPLLQVCGMLVWILLGGTEYFHLSALCWAMFVAVLYWVLTVCLFIIYLTGVHNRIPQVPWTLLVTRTHALLL